MATKQPTFLQRLRSKGPKPRRRTDGFYQAARWRKLRRYVLSREPLCRDPFGEHAEWSEVVSATEVDHVVPRRRSYMMKVMQHDGPPVAGSVRHAEAEAEKRGWCSRRIVRFDRKPVLF